MTPEETTPAEEVISEEETTEEEVTETPEYNVEEDMTVLFSGEELTEEFQEKAKTIFEVLLSIPKLLRLLRTWRRRTKYAS